MPLKKYGVLQGTVIGPLRDADDDHYQILVQGGSTVYRIAVNVKSAAKNAPSTLLFQTTTAVPPKLKTALRALSPGYRKLASQAGGLAQDYVRGGLVKPRAMIQVPPDKPGADNDLKDKLEDATVKAMAEPSTLIYAFGERWGPETKRDQYFKFTPGNGIHDIHMNQGNSGQYKRDNGVFQDGAIYLEYPRDAWRAFFFAFQSQTFDTDNKGNPRAGAQALAPPPKTGKARKTRAARRPQRSGKTTRAPV